MRLLVKRTAMVGGGLAYDVLVPCSDVPAQMSADANGNNYTRIILDGRGKDFGFKGGFLSYEDATESPEHRAMEQGWERYQDRLRHDDKCNAEMLAIVHDAFPETQVLQKFPSLWVTGLGCEETSAQKWVTR